MNKTRVIRFFSDYKTIFILYILFTLFFSIKNIMYGNNKVFDGNKKYTFINNYIIFKNSYFNLIEGKNLYIHYPEKQWDLYKYSPSFSAIMVLFAYLPDALGLVLWNLINCLILFIGIKNFIKGPPEVIFILWFLLNEYLTSVINSQSNAMIVGLLIMAFTFFEKDKVHLAALCIIATFYIKIFGVIAALIFLFYPNKIKFIKWCILWGVLIGLLPLFFNTLEILAEQYKNWYELLRNDHEGNFGYSFMGVLHSVFGLNSGKDILVILGLITMIFPLFFIKTANNLKFRINWFSAILIWMIIFNHKAESPTFIIALSGIAIWYFSSDTKDNFKTILLLLAFVFTSLSPTDIFPAEIRKSVFEQYAVKAVPCIFIWLYIIIDLVKSGINSIGNKPNTISKT